MEAMKQDHKVFVGFELEEAQELTQILKTVWPDDDLVLFGELRQLVEGVMNDGT